MEHEQHGTSPNAPRKGRLRNESRFSRRTDGAVSTTDATTLLEPILDAEGDDTASLSVFSPDETVVTTATTSRPPTLRSSPVQAEQYAQDEAELTASPTTREKPGGRIAGMALAALVACIPCTVLLPRIGKGGAVASALCGIGAALLALVIFVIVDGIAGTGKDRRQQIEGVLDSSQLDQGVAAPDGRSVRVVRLRNLFVPSVVAALVATAAACVFAMATHNEGIGFHDLLEKIRELLPGSLSHIA